MASVAVLGGIGCTDDQGDPIRSVKITQEALGDAWPFAVAGGSLRCRDGAVTFRTGGTTYGLNPPAREEGAPAPFPIWLWAGGPVVDRKVSLTPLIERGLELCE